MFKAPVFTADGTSSGERELPGGLFDGTVNEPVMWQAVKAYLANQRQGTAATKTRAHVSGGNKKPWRQKGTGRARQGSTRSPQWRGGGSVFGPRADRNFHQDLPKQVRRLARQSAFNVRAQDGGVRIVEGLAFDTPKTKRVIALIEATNAAGNVLILTSEHSPSLYLSARNLDGVQVRLFGDESTYDLLWADTLIIEAPALERVVGEVSNA
jgi:large subunit ribosomal protein L4